MVIVRLPGAREISTRVLESSGRHLWLDLPPVLHRGARLDLLWGAKGIAHAAVATVLAPRAPHHMGLPLSLGDVHAVERRVLERWKPRRALRSQLALPDGQLVSADVLNLSLGGFAARVEGPIAAGTPIEVTLFDGNGAPVLFDIDAEVRRCAADGDDWHVASVSFRARGVVAMTLARLR
jgi:hypothetical protein